MKKRLLLVTALILLLSFCLQGCSALADAFKALENAAPSYAPYERPTYSGSEPIPYSEYTRPYMPRLEPMPFSQMSYTRPNADALRSEFEEIGYLSENAFSDEVIEAYDAAYDDSIHFYTMSNLVYILYTIDLNNAANEAEYLWCEEQAPLVEQALEDCHRTLAASKLRNELEEQYFGEGFFDSYDGEGVYSNPRVVELLQQEADLQAQYMAMTSDMTVTYEDQEVLIANALAEAADIDTYFALIDLYCEKYNPIASDLFIRLVKTRRALAQELGTGRAVPCRRAHGAGAAV